MRQRAWARLVRIRYVLRHRAPLRLQRPNARAQHFDRWGILAHVGFERGQLGIGAYQLIAQPGRQETGGLGALPRIDQALAVAKTADLAEHELEPPFRLSDLCLSTPQPVASPAQRKVVDEFFRGADDR